MKINNSKVNSAPLAQAQTKEVEQKLKAGANSATMNTAAALGSTKVKLSSEAQAFQKAKAIASNDSVDEAKVARLQKLIDAGKYRVDAEAVADRLVDEHLSAGE